MNITQRGLIMQRWGVVQRELMPELRSEIGSLTSKLKVDLCAAVRNSFEFGGLKVAAETAR